MSSVKSQTLVTALNTPKVTLRKKTDDGRALVKSAEGVAALRAASTLAADARVRNPDYLAPLFVSNAHRLLLKLPHALLRRVVESMVPGGYSYFLARALYFDHQFLEAIEQGYRQIVILGAGFDTRALRFHDQLEDVDVFEVDLAHMQAHKQQVLNHYGLNSNKVTYVSSDFTSMTTQQALVDAGLSDEVPTLILLEGVSYYLEEANVSHLLSLCLACAPKSRIVFDYAEQSFLNGDVSSYGAAQMAKWLDKNNEPFKFGLASDEVRAFVNTCGLDLTQHLTQEKIIERYLIDSRGNQVGKPLGYLCFARCTHGQV